MFCLETSFLALILALPDGARLFPQQPGRHAFDTALARAAAADDARRHCLAACRGRCGCQAAAAGPRNLGQARPTISPFSSMSMRSAAEFDASPGIVRMSPVMG
jgi:hypothetical protein